MTIIRCLGLALCVSTVAAILGCDGSPHAESFRSSLPAADASKQSGSDSTESPIVTVTPKAAATISQLIADAQVTSKVYLRVRVVPGGCQGYMHKLDLDSQTSLEDHISESAGIQVVCFKRQIEMLRGAQVDFGEEDGKQGFKIDNPNFKGEWTKKWLALLEKEKDVK